MTSSLSPAQHWKFLLFLLPQSACIALHTEESFLQILFLLCYWISVGHTKELRFDSGLVIVTVLS